MASSSDQEITPTDDQTQQRSARGCTNLKKVINSRSKQGKTTVEWNEKGQPINSSGGTLLTSYFGVATRNYFQITDSHWADKSLENKKQMLWEDLIVSFFYLFCILYFCMNVHGSIYMNNLLRCFCRQVLILLKNAKLIVWEDAVKLSDNTGPIVGS
jgi:hypothetical protein